MPICALLRFLGVPSAERQAQIETLLHAAGVHTQATAAQADGLAVLVFVQPGDAVHQALRTTARQATVLAIATGPDRLSAPDLWQLLDAGAADVLVWPQLPATADEVACRLRRWQLVQQLLASQTVCAALAGQSAAWRRMLRGVVEAAHLTQASVLITGETGTGKEQIARLVHQLDSRPDRAEFVVLDCTTIAGDLSGSEFFGHERGAFTGAASARDGAFALAHRGTLFLDEVGELPLPLQAQLLRVVQERQFKRLGSNSWQGSDFRLVCATHRDLEAAVASGSFRADLYHRINGWRCHAPPLRERPQDIVPLAQFFLAQLAPRGQAPALDAAVREYLLARDYPGNVRELRQVVTRLWQRHSGSGPLTVGDVPEDERPGAARRAAAWPDDAFMAAVRQAVERGVRLKDIGQCATELATQAALEQEGGNLQRAAARLGVTDRALQIRRAQQRATQ